MGDHPSSEDWRSRQREQAAGRCGPRKRVLVPGQPTTKLTPVQLRAREKAKLDRKIVREAAYRANNRAELWLYRKLGVGIAEAKRILDAECVTRSASNALHRSSPRKGSRHE